MWLRDQIRSLKPLIPGICISGSVLSPKNLVTLTFPISQGLSAQPLVPRSSCHKLALHPSTHGP